MLENLKRWSLTAVFLIYIVILLGAYTRLRDAGLGCPDWPGCYGALLAPSSATGMDPSEINKAWTEMIHRYVAGSLGILVLFLTAKTIIWRKKIPKTWPLVCVILMLIVFQALLGMWTVTLRLYPIVVLAHLLGGLSIFALCWLLYLKLNNSLPSIEAKPQFKILAYLCLIALCVQIALGGWTSANYAALVCADFPSCQGSIWPSMDFKNAFDVAAVGIFDSPGTPLANTARVTIQMSHRLGALITTILFSMLCFLLYKQQVIQNQRLAFIGFGLLATQLVLGISNVLFGLPLFVSLMHNAVAALLLIFIITVIYNLHAKPLHN